MSSSPRPDRAVLAREAVESAMDGKLPHMNDYALSFYKERYRLTVPADAVHNTDAEEGDEIPAFVDFSNGFVVFDLNDLGGNDER